MYEEEEEVCFVIALLLGFSILMEHIEHAHKKKVFSICYILVL